MKRQNRNENKTGHPKDKNTERLKSLGNGKTTQARASTRVLGIRLVVDPPQIWGNAWKHMELIN